MEIITWIIFGAIAGWIASAFMGTREGLVMDIVVGIVGALLGGWIMSLFGAEGVTGFNFYSLVVAVIGAIVLIAIVRAIR
ncbi:MAG: Transglycosylase-associated protein [Candidatus Moranbacteria bacterium GW2011_GWF2_34_56]|nr:MAG: Transglycosylase-associated protein [Candidatus Moranbacteria bacterium GW2011_GWF1_34_10]KKP64873.1 MAG: Transglycosylase-associated protein [Candidatus Moranbacteria bacterium GW2011_GWF2_34_56]HBI16579.1 GlsB/YeaQ/YmgE family stress response membrane protein [Candidatus Moranbacteria bacterium]